MSEPKLPELPLSIERILSILPHRSPFVMVDRVTEIVPGERIRGHKCIAFNEPWFQGHFPGYPIMPGVLILEALVQVGGILAHASDCIDPTGKIMLFLGIDKARFRSPVTPGDKLDLDVEAVQRRSTLWKMRGRASVDGRLCAEADLLAQMADKKSLG